MTDEGVAELISRSAVVSVIENYVNECEGRLRETPSPANRSSYLLKMDAACDVAEKVKAIPRVSSSVEPEKCWKCNRLVTDTDTPPCEECPMHTASGAIHYLQQACEELYKHVPYRIADDVKEKATAVIDFLRAKEADPKAELGGKQ